MSIGDEQFEIKEISDLTITGTSDEEFADDKDYLPIDSIRNLQTMEFTIPIELSYINTELLNELLYPYKKIQEVYACLKAAGIEMTYLTQCIVDREIEKLHDCDFYSIEEVCNRIIYAINRFYILLDDAKGSFKELTEMIHEIQYKHECERTRPKEYGLYLSEKSHRSRKNRLPVYKCDRDIRKNLPYMRRNYVR